MNMRLQKMLSQDCFAVDFGPVTLKEDEIWYFTLSEGEQVLRLSHDAESDELRLVAEVGALNPHYRALCLDLLLAANFVPVGERGPIFAYDRDSNKIFVADFTRWSPLSYTELLDFLKGFAQEANEWICAFQDQDFWKRLASPDIEDATKGLRL